MEANNVYGMVRSVIEKYGIPLTYITGCLLLLSPLFLSNTGAKDFFNHAWLGGLYANELVSTGAFPLLINTNEAIGDALPLFYGGLSHSLIAIPAMLMNPLMATKLAMAFILAGSVAAVFCYLRDFSHESVYTCLFMSFCFGVCDYFLTNLYSRSALTEFIAVNLLVLSIIHFFRYKNTKKRVELIVSISLASFSVAAHPLAIVLLPFGLVAWLLFDREKMDQVKLLVENWYYLFLLFGSALIVFPILIYSEYTTLSAKYSMGWYPFDTILERMLPGMLDGRLLEGIKFTELSTPFLTGTLNMGAVILVLSAANFRLRVIFLLGLIFTLLLSIGELPGFNYFPEIFKSPQFYYRYNSLTQLWILGFFLQIVGSRQKPLFTSIKQVTLGLCIGIFSLSMAIKIANVFVAQKTIPVWDVTANKATFSNFDDYIPTFYGKGNYQSKSTVDPAWKNMTETSEMSVYFKFDKNGDKRVVDLPNCMNDDCVARLKTNLLSNPVLQVKITAPIKGERESKKLLTIPQYGDFSVQSDIRVAYPNFNTRLMVEFYTPLPWVVYKYVRTSILLLISALVCFLYLKNIKAACTFHERI